jgi:3-hydroxyisobutyrate dehydrogenase
MDQDIKRIGWIGTGVMGLPMAGHLMDAGYQFTIHTRTKSKAKPLLDRGATWADSPADAASGADVVFSMVGFPPDVEDAHLGSGGTLRADPLPRLVVDMTTTKPSLAIEIFHRAREKGVGSVDAPVSGGDVGAREAKLSIMVGGEAEHVRAVTPLLQRLGKTVVHQGAPGSGQHTKMVNQVLIASTMIGCCEGLLYASRAGLDPITVIESVGSGAAGSWTVNVLGPRMIQRDFDPGFFVAHFIKDLEIALGEAQRMDLKLPGLALARQLYESVRALGHDRLGTQALLLALEDMNAKRV